MPQLITLWPKRVPRALFTSSSACGGLCNCRNSSSMQCLGECCRLVEYLLNSEKNYSKLWGVNVTFWPIFADRSAQLVILLLVNKVLQLVVQVSHHQYPIVSFTSCSTATYGKKSTILQVKLKAIAHDFYLYLLPPKQRIEQKLQELQGCRDILLLVMHSFHTSWLMAD